MGRIFSALILFSIKIFSHLLYKTEVEWFGKTGDQDLKKVRLIILLNHTSLYEPLFTSILPFSFLWRLSKRMVAPGANKTLDRPLVGRFWKLMAPGLVSITRKRDQSWEDFKKCIRPDAIIMIAPEGRMKRPNGLDVDGNKMNVRRGVAEIIPGIAEGDMLIALSGGLHHVQAPGEHIPRFFKTIKMNIYRFSIPEYLEYLQMMNLPLEEAIVADLQRRLEEDCPE